MNLDHLDFSNEQFAKMRERQRLGVVLAVLQCLLLAAIAVILLVKL